VIASTLKYNFYLLLLLLVCQKKDLFACSACFI